VAVRAPIYPALLIAFVCLAPGGAFAAAGSYLCAIGEVHECMAVTGCKRVSPQEVNLSPFIAVDVDNKKLSSVAVGRKADEEDIEGFTVTDKALFLYGTQDEETWNATVSLVDGTLTGGISSEGSSFALFGHCTAKP
jgi:hypothetical protein